MPLPMPPAPSSSLTMTRRSPGVSGAQGLGRRGDVLAGPHPGDSGCHRHAGRPEGLAASRLRAPVGEPWVCAVHRHAQPPGHVEVVLGHGVRDGHGAGGVGDRGADPTDHPRMVTHLARQGERSRIDDGDQRQPRPRLRGVQAGDEGQPVVDEPRVDRHGGHVDHVGAARGEPEQVAQEPLLERRQQRLPAGRQVRGDGLHHHDGPRRVAHGPPGEVRPGLAQAFVEDPVRDRLVHGGPR